MRTDFLNKINNLQSGKNPTLINLSDFFGNINITEPSSFAFSLGERVQIQQVALYSDEIVTKAKNGDVFFNEKKRISYAGTVVYDKLGRFFSNNTLPAINEPESQTPLPTSNTLDILNTLKHKLYEHIHNLFKSMDIEGNILQKFNENMVSVKIENGKTTGYVKCILCIERQIKSKITDFAVSSKSNGNRNYWITSNFLNHLKRTHKIQSKEKTDDAFPPNEMPGAVKKYTTKKKCDQVDISSSTPGIEVVNNKLDESSSNLAIESKNYEMMVESENIEAVGVDNSEKDESTIEMMKQPERTLNLEIVAVDLPDGTDLQTKIYMQISNQLMTLEYCFTYDARVKNKVGFYMSEDQRLEIETINIPKDGNCMFHAIIHQITGKDVQSKEFNMLVKQLRAEVSSFILQNFSTFEHELKNRVYDEFPSRSSEENMDEECQIIAESLAKNGYWGGNETLYAVLLLYNVNILVINEEGVAYFIDKFDETSNKTIVLAFKLMDDIDKEKKISRTLTVITTRV